MKQLEAIKERLGATEDAPLEVMVSADRRYADVIRDGDPSDHVARCADDDYAELFAHAPEDIAKLIAALEAVEVELADLDDIQAEHVSFFDGPNVTAGSVAKNLRAAISGALA